MIYRRLIVTDQSYEVSCSDKSIVLCLAALLRGGREKNLLEKIGE